MRKFTFLLYLGSLLLISGCNFGNYFDGDLDVDVKEELKTDSKNIVCTDSEKNSEGQCEISEKGKNIDLFAANFEGKVKTSELKEDFFGFLAEPAAEGDYPGIIMIHEWWGLNDNVKYMAQLLANEGYRVLAIDLYDGNVATEAEKAREYSATVRSNPEEAVKKMQLAAKYLKEEANVTKLASLGWCFGGQQSLNLSLAEPMDATVIYYGQLVTDEAEIQKLKGPVLGIFGDKDTSIPLESVNSFQNSLNNLGKENEIFVYEGVGHAFANPSGSNYAPQQTLDAWKETINFLAENLN